ncbi:MAG: NAD(P)H-hydrate epimerase, partial [Crenarchaeota archaeon]|nr:NAD(P)H-hydrate epimerase [Thermoproteota archaeon]
MEAVVLGLGPVISSVDVAVVDENSEALGVTRLQLMENAGRSVALEAARRLRPGGRVAVFAGPGGNGGDGLAAARHLALQGFRVAVYLVSPCGTPRSREASAMLEAVNRMDYSVELHVAKSPEGLPDTVEADLVVDALLGVGARGAPRSPYREAIRLINSLEAVKLAVDVPSGLDADTGEAPGEVVRADVTVTLHKPKPGLLRRRDLAGEIVVAPIGAPPEAEVYVGPGDVSHRVPRRRWDHRKGRGGRVLIVGGSEEYTGAPIIAGLAAEAAGVDLVFIASTPNVAAAAASRPTLIPVRLEGHPSLHPDHLGRLLPLLQRVDAVAVGMGLGSRSETIEAVEKLVEEARRLGKPVVVDADALKAAGERPSILQGPRTVATPHDREYERAFGEAPPPVTCIPERVAAAARAARSRQGLVVLLKGPVDVV